MNVLIAFASNHGCSARAAARLQELLGENTRTVNLGEEAQPDLTGVDTVVVGGSIHAGRIQKAVRKFLVQNEETLLGKRLGLYLCCMEDGKKAEKQFDDNYPERLRAHASVTGLFGGAFDFDKMGFFEKAIVKKVAGVKESVSKVDEGAIEAFAEQLRAG